MTSRRKILASPRWQGFLHLDGLSDLSTPALLAADDFFRFVGEHTLLEPDAGDIARWTIDCGASDRSALLDHLADAMSVCYPAIVARIRLARDVAASQPKPASAVDQVVWAQVASWDPIAPPARKPPKPRSVSVEPWELPEAWQTALRRMAMGVPGNRVVAAQSIVRRLREKLCQFVWATRDAGFDAALSPAGIDCYVRELNLRCAKRPRGIRWATLRASVEELHRFARYTGATADVVGHLAQWLNHYQSRENCQKALKFSALAETGNTTASVLDKAEELLTKARGESCPRKRHNLRNGAGVLGLYPVFPLRPGSADLRFGVSLHWRDNQYVVELPIRKTRQHNPEPFVAVLKPWFAAFVDAILLGDIHPRHLPACRQEAIAAQRQLFVLHDGTASAPSYIPRIYKELTGNSLATTRSMIHTGLATDLGRDGREMAMAACHRTSEASARAYEAEAVAIAAISRRQHAASAGREEYDLGPLDLS